MELQHIELEHLRPAKINVRKKGGKNVDDLVPSIRTLGVLQPLLVRPNCEGYEVIAGQRRYHAACKLAEEGEADVSKLPCIVMADGDDAKAIEASLAENVARLPMDEIDQYKAFAALVKQGRSIEDVANHFGVTERLVKQRLAIANLITPVLNAYRKDEINAVTVRSLTLATKKQQKEWWALYQSDDYAPEGHALKQWLFGGASIPVSNALFEPQEYVGSIVSDLFGDESYFDDAETFWPYQNTAIAEAKDRYLANGWSDVIVFDIGDWWPQWDYQKVPKKDGGKVYVQIAHDGEVTFHEGYLTTKEAKRLAKAKAKRNGTDGSNDQSTAPDKPELTKPMQNYLDLHRHAAVRTELLSHSDIALRLVVAQIIAFAPDLWTVYAEPQKAFKTATAESLKSGKAETAFAEERAEILALLGIDTNENNVVPHRGDFDKERDLAEVFAKLLTLSDNEVLKVLNFVAAETLQSGTFMVEVLGKLFGTDMANYWQADDAFFDLLRDKDTINAMLKHIAGKATADAHVTSTAKVQKNIIQDCINGTRKPAKPDWLPRYMTFPMTDYTKRGGIDAIDKWRVVKRHFV